MPSEFVIIDVAFSRRQVHVFDYTSTTEALARPDLFRRLTMAEKHLIREGCPTDRVSEGYATSPDLRLPEDLSTVYFRSDILFRSTLKRPNFWWRMWQYLLLGWRWKKIEGTK